MIKKVKYEPLLSWTLVQEKLQWGVIFLLGGGFAVASAAKETGLSALVASKIAKVKILFSFKQRFS